MLYGRTRRHSPHGELGDAVDAFENIRALTGGVAVPLLFDARHVGWLQFKAREYVHRHAAELFTRAAVIIPAPMPMILNYSLLGHGGLGIPLRLFATEDDAWSFASAVVVP